MSDYSNHILIKTWNRAVDCVNKIGYMDGAADGQTASFQSSFDMGYEQGVSFGLQLGFKEAKLRVQQGESDEPHFTDPRSINCQICIDNNTSQENIVNLYNKQKEKNDGHLQKSRTQK